MAGILASSATKPMAAGETAAIDSESGYIVAEQITLSTTPTGTDYVWGQAIPSGATPARCALSATTGASVTFTPDIAGFYVITCTVDSVTTYVLTLSITDTVAATALEALRLQQKLDSAVPTPAAGAIALYCSDLIDQLAQRDTNGRITPVGLVGTTGANLTDADQTLQIGEGVHRTLPDATLTAGRNKTLGTTNAALGHVIWIHRLDATAFTCAVINGGGGGGTLLTFPVSERHSAAFRFDGSNWALHERRKLV